MSKSNKTEPATVCISGAGIVGLTVALCLQKHAGIVAEVYEKTPELTCLGAGMAMFPNGLRVFRDLDEDVLNKIRDCGQSFLSRRFSKHNGVEIAEATEEVLHKGDDESLQSFGVGRWRLHQVLLEVAQERQIPVYFGKTTTHVVQHDDEGLVELQFQDGTSRQTRLLLGTDGTRSFLRKFLLGTKQHSSHLMYNGVTCWMGIADCAKPDTGVCCPSSLTTKCHATYFPIQDQEQCFQLYFPQEKVSTNEDDDGEEAGWGAVSEKVGKEECHKLAERLRDDQWDEKYLTPLEEVRRAVRVAFCELQPPLKQWAFGRIVLLGDAAHPPIPYTGQGAQLGLEDAATLALLLKEFCSFSGKVQLQDDASLNRALAAFQRLRIPRAAEVQKLSNSLGTMQQRQAECKRYARKQAMMIQREVFFHETLPIYIPGAQYDYAEEVQNAIRSS